MDLKSFALLLVIILLAFGYMMYYLPGSVRTGNVSHSSQTQQEIAYNQSNMRWSGFPLRVFIDSSFVGPSSQFLEDVRDAMMRWENAVNFISFREVRIGEDYDIKVKWVSSLKERSLDATGDTETTFFDMGNFKLIREAEIRLLTKLDNTELSNMDMTNIALHELGHAIGLGHIGSESSIMQPSLEIPSLGIREISSMDIINVQGLYAETAKPDIKFSGTMNATKFSVSSPLQTTHYVNTTFTIKNSGLLGAENVTFEIRADNNVIMQDSVGAIPVGQSTTLTLGNIQVDSDFDILKIGLDEMNTIDEMNEENNVVVLSM